MNPTLSHLVTRFFTTYLANERGVSKNTIAAYSDTLRLLIKQLCKKHGKQPEHLSMEMLGPEAVLDFLDHLEHDRNNSPSTRSALDEWLHLRSFHAGNGNSAPLLVSAPNKRLTRQQARRAFRRLCEKCGLQGKPPPRLHDLRHNHASECLARWQREGKDIQSLLPVLSTAMGHVNPCATQCYIHINATTLLDASGKIHDRFIQPTEENQ